MYKDILLSVDLAHGGHKRKAHEIAIEYCQAFKSTLHVITVVPESGMAIVNQFFNQKHMAEDLITKVNDKLHDFTKEHIPEDVPVQHIVTTGNVYESIINAAEKIDCDLIIMSAHKPVVKDFLLGPNASKVVRHSTKSVLVVRG